jgi:hypothetical protein
MERLEAIALDSQERRHADSKAASVTGKGMPGTCERRERILRQNFADRIGSEN